MARWRGMPSDALIGGRYIATRAIAGGTMTCVAAIRLELDCSTEVLACTTNALGKRPGKLQPRKALT